MKKLINECIKNKIKINLPIVPILILGSDLNFHKYVKIKIRVEISKQPLKESKNSVKWNIGVINHNKIKKILNIIFFVILL